MNADEPALKVFVLNKDDLKRLYEISPQALGWIETSSEMNMAHGYRKRTASVEENADAYPPER